MALMKNAQTDRLFEAILSLGSVEECYQVPLEQAWKGILNDSLRASELETDSERKNLSVALSRVFDALEVGKEKQPVILIKKVSTPSIHTKAAIQELQNISQMRRRMLV